MTLRSLSVVLALAVMTFACEQKIAPADNTGDDDDSAEAADTSKDAKDSKDTPAKVSDDDAKKNDTPAATTTTTNATTPTPAKTDDTKTTTATTTPPPADKTPDTTNPLDVGSCVAACKDPDCFSKCFGDNGGGFGGFGF